jgi:hypothetical protein
MTLRIVSLFAISAALFASGGCASSEDSEPGSGATGGGGAAGAATGGSGGTTSAGGSGGSNTGGSAGSAGSGIGGTSSVDAGPPTTVSGRLVDLQDATKPVVGVQVCVFEDNSIPCVSTDSNGDFTLNNVPSGIEILLELTKTDYFPTLITLTTDANPVSLGSLLAPSKLAVGLLAIALGTTVDPSKGQLLFNAFTPAEGGAGYDGEANVTAALQPMSGAGPYYFDANQLPDKTLTATTVTGAGVYANVNPGYAEVTLTSSKSCTRLATAWAGSKPTTSKVRIVAGYLTGGAAIDCPN